MAGCTRSAVRGEDDMHGGGAGQRLSHACVRVREGGREGGRVGLAGRSMLSAAAYDRPIDSFPSTRTAAPPGENA